MKSSQYLFLTVFYIYGLQFATAQITFTTATNYNVISMPVCILASDVNGDGDVDIVCAGQNNYIGTLSVSTNNGSGVFAISSTVKVGVDPVSIVMIDINGRGKPDLACADYASGIIYILTNNGTGFFSSNAILSGVTGWFPTSLSASDINGDGKQDLICGSGKGITVYTNGGNGLLVSNATYYAGVPGQKVISADINGDGKPDLLYAGLGEFFIWTNNGVGSFSSNSTVNVGFNFGSSFYMADFNGAGKPDLLFADGAAPSHFSIWTNNGSGVFGLNASFTAGLGVASVVAADIDGDGTPELVCANSLTIPGTLSVLTNNGFGVYGSNATCNAGSYAVLAADVNADGKLDLVSLNRNSGTFSVLVNTSLFAAPIEKPSLNINATGNGMLVSWPSESPGWSLQQNPDLKTPNWGPSGYSGFNISDDGTNKSLSLPASSGNLFFRLLHP